jgi:hypothetical protein
MKTDFSFANFNDDALVNQIADQLSLQPKPSGQPVPSQVANAASVFNVAQLAILDSCVGSMCFCCPNSCLSL